MKTVLIVEDNPSHLKLAALLMSHLGFQTLSAADAKEGLRRAREERPDVILMDIQLPGMDGLAATRELKRDPATRDIPVIAVTSYLADYPEREARAAGCAGFIAKPYHHADLQAAVEAAIVRLPNK